MEASTMRTRLTLLALLALTTAAVAGVGDPQTRTDHPFYPGELAFSTFDRMWDWQAKLYERVTDRTVDNEEDKVLASWYFRNIMYHHSTAGRLDVWNKGHAHPKGEMPREYWDGLFGYGYGLCFTTHHQWCGEMEEMLGMSRCRHGGLGGHTTFEAYLKGGEYGDGKWVLLDHDISTVAFTKDEKRLAGLLEIRDDMSLVTPRRSTRGWMVGGLYPGDTKGYRRVRFVGYVSGYASVPPMVNLRAGETLRRYFRPGLEDGKTYVYWGINYNRKGIGGPFRGRTWVHIPEKLYGTKRDCGFRNDNAGRYGNAVFTYVPDFQGGAYKEGVVDESDSHVTFEWYSPYIVAATPPESAAEEKWGIHEDGCSNGLVVHNADCKVEVSTDQGKTWQTGRVEDGKIELTDQAKGHFQYLLKFHAAPKDLADKDIKIVTVAQCAQTVVPQVKAGKNQVTYQAGGKGFFSAGPNLDQAQAHVVEGSLPGREPVTLELEAPRGAKAVHVYGACRVASGAPPKPAKYDIEYSLDGGETWKPVVKGWHVIRRQPEVKDWWSQTFPQGHTAIEPTAGPVRVRFKNDSRVKMMRAEAHLVYEVENTSPVKVVYAWKEGDQVKNASHTFKDSTPGKADESFTFEAGEEPKVFYVEYAAE
jgi:hypothetical protein